MTLRHGTVKLGERLDEKAHDRARLEPPSSSEHKQAELDLLNAIPACQHIGLTLLLYYKLLKVCHDRLSIRGRRRRPRLRSHFTIAAASRPTNSSLLSIVILQRIPVLLGAALSCIGSR